ncbi:hypothetical protein BU23DRAFT_604862 [Bimuria novae-zelandiae CBS 107.79]|uniref:Uncharacterized protein n=1 Tax=Bimuria novae-zelandiae CBS 107.79 TaxID=1447943 RepID=A0A6A5UJ22_9PLEO|nr:hypothetical protein BU23DRAFT_604862 [Bimuria novae-zelandiae CBS 107.79]
MATIRHQRLLNLGSRSRVRGVPSSSFSPTAPLWGRPKQFQRTISDARPLKASVSDAFPRQAFLPSTLPLAKQSRRIPVRPTGWETNKETELLPMTLLGQTMPKIYALILEVFKLPEEITVEQQEGIYPILTGVMEWDEKSGEIGVRKNKDNALGFEVRYLDGEGDEFPTFSQLESRHFHADLIDSDAVYPKFTQGLVPAEGLPAAQGSVFLPTQFDFAATSETLPTVPFRAVEKTLDIDRSALAAERPNPARWEQIKDLFPQLTEEPMPPLPEGFVFPELEITMLHFPKKKVEQLKVEAMAQVGEGKWISTYDAIMGLMWQSVTRARLDFLQPDPESHSMLGHMVDIRKKVGISTSERFIGITSLPPPCGPLKIKRPRQPRQTRKGRIYNPRIRQITHPRVHESFPRVCRAQHRQATISIRPPLVLRSGSRRDVVASL